MNYSLKTFCRRGIHLLCYGSHLQCVRHRSCEHSQHWMGTRYYSRLLETSQICHIFHKKKIVESERSLQCNSLFGAISLAECPKCENKFLKTSEIVDCIFIKIVPDFMHQHMVILISFHLWQKFVRLCFVNHSNMTWFFSRIKSTDTNWALFTDNAQFPIQPVVIVFLREVLFRESVLLSVFWVPWVKWGHY